MQNTFLYFGNKYLLLHLIIRMLVLVNSVMHIYCEKFISGNELDESYSQLEWWPELHVYQNRKSCLMKNKVWWTKGIHEGAVTLDTSIRLNIMTHSEKVIESLRQPRDGSRRRPCIVSDRYPEPGVTYQIQGQDHVQMR